MVCFVDEDNRSQGPSLWEAIKVEKKKKDQSQPFLWIQNYYDELIRSRGDATSDSTAAGCQQMSIFAFQISDVSDPSHGAMPGVM